MSIGIGQAMGAANKSISWANGQTAADDASVLLIACGALAKEIADLIAINRWHHLRVTCLPAELHNRPVEIPDAVRARIREGKAAGYRDIAVLYADCGTGGLLDKMLAEEQVERIGGPHCYAFYSGLERFSARAEDDMTCFYLTDFLARHFDRLIVRGLGLDRHPELKDDYFRHYERLVYLAQSADETLDAKARQAADYLGLNYERRETGYGDLGAFLSSAAGRRRGAD